MSSWGEIKSLINSDLGKDNFLSIDKLIMFGKEYIIPSEFKGSASDLEYNHLIKEWIFNSTPTKNVKFKALTNGYILIYFSEFRSNTNIGSISIYNNESLVKNLSSKVIYENVILQIFKGDIVNIVFDNPAMYENGGKIKMYGELVDHYGLREVHQ